MYIGARFIRIGGRSIGTGTIAIVIRPILKYATKPLT